MDTETLQQRQIAWSELAGKLRDEGWEATVISIAAPVQMEGCLPTGERFYFRARNNNVCLGIGGEDPADVPNWEECEQRDKASWISAAEGRDIIRRLTRYYAKCGTLE